MQKQNCWFVVVCLIFLSACERASETLVSIPNVSVSCTEATCGAGIDGSQVRVIMTRSGCENVSFEPVATSSSSLSCSSSGCSALLSSWVDANQNEVTDILTGTMSICGLIDLDSDFQEDAGELEHSSELSIQSSSLITAESWSTI